ncbi:MAG: hypothetical protein IJQ86_06685 [Spirochaetia bacterium]|nr:hypothetical protein [Spirochaetia bacterium]
MFRTDRGGGAHRLKERVRAKLRAPLAVSHDKAEAGRKTQAGESGN